jgi:hypothetical protein
MLVASNEYLKYLPIDKSTSSMISPILDFTAKQEFGGQRPQQYETRILNSGMDGGGNGKVATKRSVSETKKKVCSCKTKLALWRLSKTITCVV